MQPCTGKVVLSRSFLPLTDSDLSLVRAEGALILLWGCRGPESVTTGNLSHVRVWMPGRAPVSSGRRGLNYPALRSTWSWEPALPTHSKYLHCPVSPLARLSGTRL